jgi:energy-converting hydrogenase Eha subunit B
MIGHAVSQAVSSWPVIVEDRVCAGVRQCGTFGGQSETVISFLRVLRVFAANIISPMFQSHTTSGR